jgi:nucleoid-associated protein
VPDIAINKAVVHVLNKEQREDIREPTMRTEVFDPHDAAVHKLVEGIMAVYGKRHSSADYGVFASGVKRKPFCDAFEAYAGLQEPSNDEFMRLTVRGMADLQTAAEHTPLASGGYIVFIDYTIPQGRYFAVAMLKQKPGITISADLHPRELMQLDLDRLAQAARISFHKLGAYATALPNEQHEMNYLSFVSPNSSKKSAGYFVAAIGCVRGAASARATEIVLRESTLLFRSRSELKPYAQRLKEQMVTFLAGRVGQQSVKLSEIGELIRQNIPIDMDDDERNALVDGFLERLNSEEFGVPTEFSANKSVVNRHTTISGEADYWKATIDRGAIGETDDAAIYYHRESGKLVFTQVPEKMKVQIEAELDSRTGPEETVEIAQEAPTEE